MRFFERVKLERRIQQLEGKQARGHALTAEEQQALINAKGDLQVCHHLRGFCQNILDNLGKVGDGPFVSLRCDSQSAVQLPN